MQEPKDSNRLKQLAWGGVFLLLGVAGLVALTLSRPPLAKRTLPKPVPVVEVVRATRGPVRITVKQMGEVRPWKLGILSAQVRGRVEEISPALEPGAGFTKGQVLVRIDDADYRLALVGARAQLNRAIKELAVLTQEAEASVATWKAFAKKGLKPPPLVAKEPQLKAARAAVAAAKAAVAQAKLNLSRTRITAPFTGKTIARIVELGDYVVPGKVLARIYSTEAVEVVVYMLPREAEWVSIPGFNTAGEGSVAVVEAAISGKPGRWKGRVVRALGEIDRRTRMIGVVVRVPGAFSSLPPLVPGAYAKVSIIGREVANATELPARAVHEGPVVWVAQGGQLRIKKVSVAWREPGKVVIAPGLEPGTRVVVSNLSVVTDGMAIKPVESSK